jgi:hypothetical protein
MNCPSAYRHNIHRDTFDSVKHRLQTRCTSGIRTHLGKINAHNHSVGNDLAHTLANHVADGKKTFPTVTKDSKYIQSNTKVLLTLITGMGR